MVCWFEKSPISSGLFWWKLVITSQVGMTLVADHSGRVFSAISRPSIKDVVINREARYNMWKGYGCENYISRLNMVLVLKFMFPEILNTYGIPCKVILATIKGLEGKVRPSKRVLQTAILHFYTERRLFPRGVVAEMDSAREWAMKMGKALKRLVFWQPVTHSFYVWQNPNHHFVWGTWNIYIYIMYA